MPTTPSTASVPPPTTRSTALRGLVALIASSSLLITQTTSLAGPHDEGLAAGRAANPVIRGGITTPGASAAVPGYTSSPGERSFYRQPNLAAQGNTLLAACASTPQDPVCQALLGAQASANTARPGLAVDDPRPLRLRGRSTALLRLSWVTCRPTTAAAAPASPRCPRASSHAAACAPLNPAACAAAVG